MDFLTSLLARYDRRRAGKTPRRGRRVLAVLIALLLIAPAQVAYADSTITTTTATTVAGAMADDPTEHDSAQSFVATQTGTIASVSIGVASVGSPTGNLVVTLETDSGSDSPSGTVLATVTVTAASVSSAASAKSFTFTAPGSVTNAVKYWVRMHATQADNVANYFSVLGTNTNPYPSGGWARFNSTSGLWEHPLNWDLNLSLTINDLAGAATPVLSSVIWW